jgi:hypothetical protein
VGARVVLEGLVARPELNGRVADVVEWVESRGRWKVRCENGEMLAVQPTSLHMAPKPSSAMSAPKPSPSSDRSSDGASKHTQGRGIPRDKAKAERQQLRTLAAQGYVEAQHNLGVMYNQGLGGPKDEAEARRLFRLAAAQGLAEAQFSLGLMNEEGRGGPKDEVEARRLYGLAAAQGLPKAQINLGLMHEEGRGGPKDEAEARRLFRLAAAQGLAEAQYSLGVMHEEGHGGPKDEAEARRLFRLAAAQGIPIESAAQAEGATTAIRPARKADAASAIAPWVGARVTLCGLASRPELNGRMGVVDRRNMTGGVERWEVQLVDRQKPGMRDGAPILIKPANMQVLSTPPPASSRRGKALQISPCPLEAARDAIPVSVAPEPFPAATEVQEMAILQASRGWRRVLGLKAYTARATYPDLYVYFDGADQTSPINRLGMRAFSAYPSDIGGLPAHGIRGEMVAIRLEPPRVRSFRFDQGEAAAEAHAVEDRHASQFVQTIEVEEMRDTLLFYTTRDAAEIARDRDLRRMMAIDGGRFTWPEMPTMPSRGGAGVGTGADAPALSRDERLQRLVQRVRNSSADAAGALADMRDDESRVAIARAGGIVPLVALLTAQDPAAGATRA